VAVTGMPAPRTIYDFSGFPRALFETRYPAPGSPALAERLCAQLPELHISIDQQWGLDHGTWSVLRPMYPQADIPVIQLSLDRSQGAAFHYQLGQQLRFLRDEGVLVVGSGNVVHNLRTLAFNGPPFDWAIEWDEMVRRSIVEGNHTPLIEYEKQGRAAQLSINSAEHYLPLLYVLGMQTPGEVPSFFADEIFAGSLSMRGVKIG
jgi:4,5-DOPA dioxygenase extradiol